MEFFLSSDRFSAFQTNRIFVSVDEILVSKMYERVENEMNEEHENEATKRGSTHHKLIVDNALLGLLVVVVVSIVCFHAP